jgi:hypothetical protein
MKRMKSKQIAVVGGMVNQFCRAIKAIASPI